MYDFFLSFISSHPLVLLLLLLVLWAAVNYTGKFGSGPTELPILGALPWLLQNRHDVLGALLKESKRQSFRTWTVKWFGESRYIMIMSPENLKHILKDNWVNYPKGADFCTNVGDLLGKGIFASDGAEWKGQRHLFASLFSERTFNTAVIAAFVSHGAALEAALRQAAATGATLDLFSLLNRFTLDTIGEIAFGSTIGSLQDAHHPFAAAFDEAQQTLDLRFFTPGWQLLKPLMASERRLQESIAVMDAFCVRLIATRRREVAEGGSLEGKTDVLSRAMCLQEPPDSGNYPYRDNDRKLRDLVINFLIAGRDTTAQALSWALLSVCTSPPEVERQLSEEGARLCPPSAGRFAPSYEALEKELPYTSACMRETLRLFPSVPKDVKVAEKADTLPDGTRVPGGAKVAYLPYVMGRSTELWGPTAAQFLPARFFTDKTLPSPWKFPAFNGAGPRQCLGQRMALAEANFVLALLFSRFTFTLSPEQCKEGGCPYADSLTLPMARGLFATVTEKLI